MDRREGRVHYGRQTIRSEGVNSERARTSERRPLGQRQSTGRSTGNRPNDRRSSTSSWYNKESAETARARRYNRDSSVWDEDDSTRSRRASRQGTAQDARRTQRRHENQSHRTQSRRTVYNTGGLQDDVDMFQAVASEERAHSGNRNVLDGVNARGSWRSSNSSDYPALRDHHRMDLLRIALPIALLVILVVAIVLGIRSCTGA